METINDELLERSLDFIRRSHRNDRPFFLWHHLTRMHVITRLPEKWENSTGFGLYADGMAQFDWVVGELLQELEALGIAGDTIVVVSTDKGAEVMTWPDGGNTPFHGEKGATWEGCMRVPQVVRWPGMITPGTIVNDMPYVVNLRQDSSERFMRESKMSLRWYAEMLWTFVPAQSVVADFIATFKDFSPSQPSATFGPDQALSAPGRGN
jgi:hypothetical protein